MTATISDRYELGDRLGSGGMSTVYRATDRVLERTVAVKILAEHLSDDDKFVARFRREALAVAKLIHPNIVQVYDTGVDAGPPLHRHGVRRGQVGAPSCCRPRAGSAPTSTAEIGIQACAGLEYAHRQGIIHRDVKPGNLMVIGGPAGRRRRDSSAHEPPTGEMTIKLTDFGIARATAQSRLTQVGSVVGTAAYLAPEQARGEEATPAADVYALGVVLYQLLTGRLPWEGSTLAELAIRRENERPLPPTSYDPDVPETLSAAVLRSLEGEASAPLLLRPRPLAGARGRAARPGAAAAVRRAADRHAGRRPSTAATRRIAPEPATPVSPAAGRARRRPASPRRARWRAGPARPKRSARRPVRAARSGSCC